MKIKIFSNEFDLVKAIKGNDPGQVNIFGQPIAGMEKEFAPGDKRRLEVTGGGKLRWKNADEKSGQQSIVSGQEDKKRDDYKAIIKKAGELGEKAFKDGKKRIPVQDPELLKLFEGFQVGEGIKPTNAWLKAWDKANLSTPIPKREITAPSYRPLQEGEESSVERKYKAYKELKFFAAHEKIESPQDVAFLFRQLEDETVEHAFIVHETKEHGTIVQHLTSGSYNSSIVDPALFWDAIDRFGTEKIHLVHNHPSGNLQPSNEDLTIWKKIKEGLPRKVEMMPGVILDAREGKYSYFNPDLGTVKEGMPRAAYATNAKPVKALRFSRQIFKENATLPKERIIQPDDIVKFVYQGKYTDGDKAQVFALSSRNSIVGRFNISSPLDDPKKVADEIAVLLGRSGGVNAIISTNKSFDAAFESKLNAINQQLQIKDIVLFDCISVSKKNNKNWKSAVGERIMENKVEYKKSVFRTLLKAFGQQISLFGKEAYSDEGKTKEGKGGTLQLTRDKTGKGAHWRILNKKQPAISNRQSTADEEEKDQNNKGKIITPAQAYDLLQDKLGNKIFVTDKDGNLLGGGTFQLINENSEGNYSLFLSEKNGYDSVISVPKNQAVMVMEGGVQFKFADKNITVSTKEKSKDATKPIEIERADENAKRARDLEKMRNYNRWNEKAEDFAELGRGQKNWFFNDLEDVANLLDIEFSHNNRIAKTTDTLFREIKRNAEKFGQEEIHSALIGAFEVGSTYKMRRIISELKDKGYIIDAPDILNKESFFTRVKIKKGENDPLPKELQFATPELAQAAEECAKKPNILRETETSLKLKVKAERIPEHDTIKRKLFNQAGEGLGQLWITGGLPGSGKSSVLESGFHKNKIVIDPDAIKYMIAEERGISKEDVNKKPWDLHEESSLLAKHLTREAVRDGKDVIYDISMKGTDNLADLLELVKNDTYQANAKFIHVPLEKGIERDRMRGEKGGRAIGAELYEKIFSDYPTHKTFFQLKDDFDNFDVYDNSAPLGEGAKLFYQKINGKEHIYHPEIYNEFQRIGRSKVEKSIPLPLTLTQSNKMNDEEMNMSNNTISDSDKIKMLFRQMNGGQVGFDEEHEIDPEQDFFELGMLKMHGLIDENMMLTLEGELRFEKEFDSKIPKEEEKGKTNFNSILNPKKNIADKQKDQEQIKKNEL